ncbi:MAG TPA: ABC transporter permease, partial [Bryobacteraceae bacterium]|nr:ABC transporter permease [Bryobacteraceae bacterium]
MLVPVMPDYFRTMGGRVLRGREFTDAEAHVDARVAIVSERFAGEFGSPADALGHEVTIGSAPPWRIIGMVKGMDYMTDGANINQ